MTWNKKAYDREYQRKRAEKLYADFCERRLKVFNLLGGKCFLCEKPAVKGFHLHHVEYHPTESDYPRNSKSMVTRLKRLKEAEEHPERFCLLCPKHHSMVEFMLRKLKGICISRLFKLLKLSTPTMRKQET